MSMDAVKNSWEWKTARFIFKFFLYSILLLYIAFTLPAATNWVKQQWMAFDIPPEQRIDFITQETEKGNKVDALLLMQIVPLDQNEELFTALAPLTPTLPNSYFFTLSQRAFKAGNLEDGVFWEQYARWRLRYDALRCKGVDMVEVSNRIANIGSANKYFDYAITQNPNLIKKSIQRVLDFDAQYPPANNPSEICKAYAKVIQHSSSEIVEEEHWEQVRETLRATTENFLLGIDPVTGEKTETSDIQDNP